MPIDAADVAEWLDTLHAAVPSALGEANPARIYARTKLGSAPSRWWLLQADPDGLHPALPTAVNRLNVDGTGNPDLSIRITPDMVTGPSGASVQGVVIELNAINPAQPLTNLQLDIGVRLDGPIAPPDGATDAEFVVLGIDAGPFPLASTVTIVVALGATGTAGAVGSTATTQVTLGTNTGGTVAAADHPLLLRVETHTGASRSQSATVVVPTTPTGTVLDLPVDLPGLGGGGGGGGPVATDISVPNESGPVTEASRIQVQLRRPGVRPHLAPPVVLTLLREIRAVEPTGPVFRDRIEWRSPYDVTLTLFVDDLVTGRHTVVETAALPSTTNLDIDMRRANAAVPHLQYDADETLAWLRMRDEQPSSTDALRFLAVHALGIPTSLGLRLETAAGSPLRVVLCGHTSTDAELPAPLAGAAALLARTVGQLPSVVAGLPQPLPLAEQTVAVDIDDVPATSPSVLPRLFVSARALRFVRVQENVAAPVDEPVHAGPGGGLIVDLRLGPDERPAVRGKSLALPHRALRLQMFRQVDPDPGETGPVHTRLLVRAGSLPDRTVVDLRTEPPTPDDEVGYFGLRLWGRLRWVQALNLDRAAGPSAVDGSLQRLHVAVPVTPDRWVDVRRDRESLQVTGTEPVEAEVGLIDRDGIDPDGLLTRLVARVTVPERVTIPTVEEGFQVDAGGRGLTARVALTGTALDPLAVRATPQVAMLQRPAIPVALTDAVTGRVYGVTHLRQGGDPGFVPEADEVVSRFVLHLHEQRPNTALRLRRRERPDTTGAGRDVMKLAVADLAEELTAVTREGPPTGDERTPAVIGTRRPTLTALTLSRTTGRAVLWSEPEQRPYDGPRAGAAAGIGVVWLEIDALPRRLEVAPLFDGRYVPDDETRPTNWAGIPANFTRDGLRIGVSDTLTVREMLQAGWDRDRTDGTDTIWGLAYARLMQLAMDDPVPDGEDLRRLWVWNPSRRLDDSEFAEPNSALGVRVGAGARFTLDLDRYEQSAPGTPHWDDLPASWPLRAEVQFSDYASQVTISKEIGAVDPTIGGGGPGLWWVRSVDAWLTILGGGSAALGNTGGPPFHKNRIFA